MQQKVKKIDRWEGLRARWTILPRGLLQPGRTAQVERGAAKWKIQSPAVDPGLIL